MTAAAEEEWRFVPGFAQRYAVSNRGRVKSFLRAGRIMKVTLCADGRERVNLRDAAGKTHWTTVKALMARAFGGEG